MLKPFSLILLNLLISKKLREAPELFLCHKSKEVMHMAVENETAEQVVKMVLEGSEVVLRLTGEAAINVAKLIYAALKGDRTRKEGRRYGSSLSPVRIRRYFRSRMNTLRHSPQQVRSSDSRSLFSRIRII